MDRSSIEIKTEPIVSHGDNTHEPHSNKRESIEVKKEFSYFDVDSLCSVKEETFYPEVPLVQLEPIIYIKDSQYAEEGEPCPDEREGPSVVTAKVEPGTSTNIEYSEGDCTRVMPYGLRIKSGYSQKPPFADCELNIPSHSRGNNTKRTSPEYINLRPLACPECNYTCKDRSNLKAHKLIHSGIKPYACPECSNTFRRSGHLKRHMITHTGEKPLACTECNYTCSQQNELKVHALFHTGEKPFACTECSYACRLKATLVRHKLTHTSVKPFACSVCKYTCRLKSHLKRHYMLKHINKCFEIQ